MKKFCLRERNRFLKNLVYNQEATTGSAMHYVFFALLHSIILYSEKKAYKISVDLRVYMISTLIRKSRNKTETADSEEKKEIQ